jgi:hypothetical protein
MTLAEDVLTIHEFKPSKPILPIVIDNMHCLASQFTGLPFVPYQTQRAHVWSLSLPDGSVWLFQVNSQPEMQHWIDFINHWNARWSVGSCMKSGFTGVGSQWFGWEDHLRSECKESFHPPPIMRWYEPESIFAFSQLSPDAQQDHCKAQLQWHEKELSQHVTYSQTFETISLDCISRALNECFEQHDEIVKEWRKAKELVLMNWKKRLEYLNREIVKWRTYFNAGLQPSNLTKVQLGESEKEAHGTISQSDKLSQSMFCIFTKYVSLSSVNESERNVKIELRG